MSESVRNCSTLPDTALTPTPSTSLPPWVTHAWVRRETTGSWGVAAKNATTAADGKTCQVEYFNFDAILSVTCRVNSKRGTQFRL